jgi:hypothetical protein
MRYIIINNGSETIVALEKGFLEDESKKGYSSG